MRDVELENISLPTWIVNMCLGVCIKVLCVYDSSLAWEFWNL